MSRNDGDEMVEIDYDEVAVETAAAALFKIGDEKVWLPLSEIEIDEEEKKVSVPQRLAEDRGLV